MEPTYLAMFNLGKQGKSSEIPSLDEVIESITMWAEKVEKRTKKPVITVQNASDNKGEYFALRITHRDLRIDNLAWQTDIALAKKDHLHANIVLSKGWADHTIKQTPQILSRPGIVPELITNFGAYQKFNLATKPSIISIDSAEGFVKAITNPDRRIPIIYTSQSNNPYSQRTFDLEKLAFHLAGISHVAATNSIESSIRIELLLKQAEKEYDLKENSLNCFNGAVRAYFAFDGGNFKNPFYKYPELQSIKDFSDEILKNLLPLTIRRREQITYNIVRQIALKQRANKASKSEEKELLAVTLEENSVLTTQNTEQGLMLEKLSANIEEKDLDNQILQEDISRLEQAMKDARTYQTLVVPNVNTIEEAVNAIAEEFSDQILIHPKAIKQAQKSSYKKPKEIYQLLKWLATDYRESKMGNLKISNMNHECLVATGFQFRSHQNSVMMGKYPSDYFLQLGSEKLTLEEHCCKGISFDSRETIRVCPIYDSKTEKVVIGFIGQHQKTRQSN